MGERGVVGFIVAAAAVAHEVNNNVFVERLPELESQLSNSHHGLGVIAIHVEDRCLHHAGNVSGIDRGSTVFRAGGESNLVVDDDMHGSAGAITLQL